MSCFIIAEAGVNHNGDMAMARQLIAAAKDAGADAVKFQTFTPSALVSQHAAKADYQQKTTGSSESQLDMLRKLALSEADHEMLRAHCDEQQIAFLSSPFDLDSATLLTDHYHLPRIKLGSGEITNGPLLLQLARSGVDMILSTGMCTLDDIRAALSLLAWGYRNSAAPTKLDWNGYWEQPESRQVLTDKITLLHCTTEYPAPYNEINLRAMDTLAETFGLPVGYSDHTPGIEISLAAVARGACVIEKHFTLDRTLPGPDHQASLEPDELSALVQGIRHIEQALGDGIKQPSPSERKNMQVARKSLVALTSISSGDRFTTDNLGCKRPGTGLSPMDYWDWLGKTADRDYAPDEEITP